MNMKLLVVSLAVGLLVTNHGSGQEFIPLESVNWGFEDGLIILRNPEPIESVIGIDFWSEDGHFVPISPPDPLPFTFLLSNTSESIVFAAVPAPVAVPANWKTGIGYSGPIERIALDISVTGLISTDFLFRISYCDRPPTRGFSCTPEPTSGFLLCVPLIGLGWMRKRRRRLP